MTVVLWVLVFIPLGSIIFGLFANPNFAGNIRLLLLWESLVFAVVVGVVLAVPRVFWDQFFASWNTTHGFWARKLDLTLELRGISFLLLPVVAVLSLLASWASWYLSSRPVKSYVLSLLGMQAFAVLLLSTKNLFLLSIGMYGLLSSLLLAGLSWPTRSQEGRYLSMALIVLLILVSFSAGVQFVYGAGGAGNTGEWSFEAVPIAVQSYIWVLWGFSLALLMPLWPLTFLHRLSTVVFGFDVGQLFNYFLTFVGVYLFFAFFVPILHPYAFIWRHTLAIWALVGTLLYGLRLLLYARPNFGFLLQSSLYVAVGIAVYTAVLVPPSSASTTMIFISGTILSYAVLFVLLLWLRYSHYPVSRLADLVYRGDWKLTVVLGFILFTGGGMPMTASFVSIVWAAISMADHPLWLSFFLIMVAIYIILYLGLLKARLWSSVGGGALRHPVLSFPLFFLFLIFLLPLSVLGLIAPSLLHALARVGISP